MTPWCKSLRSCKWPPTVSSQCGDLDFQGGDLLARSLGSDPPLLAAPGQVGRAVLVAFDGGLEVFELALAPISAHCGRSGSKRRAGRVVLASLSRRRFHGGFPAYLLLLIDWWGPLSHRPSATKPITSHKAVWPFQGQPCSVPAWTCPGILILTGMMAAMVHVLWAYDGWVNITPLAEELRDPGRNIPRSLILGMGTLIAVYLGMTLAYHFVLPLSEVAAANKEEGGIEKAVAAVYCRQLLGGAGVVAISLLVMCSTFLSLYASAVCSRIAYSDQKRPWCSYLLPAGEGAPQGRMRVELLALARKSPHPAVPATFSPREKERRPRRACNSTVKRAKHVQESHHATAKLPAEIVR